MESRERKSPGVRQPKEGVTGHQESEGVSLLGVCKAQLEKAAAILMCRCRWLCSGPEDCSLTSVIKLSLTAASDEREGGGWEQDEV